MGALVWHPQWSKTQEDKIAWLSTGQDGDIGDAWIVDLDDPANPFRLTNTPNAEERAVSWSPDDSRIAVQRADAKNGRLRNHRVVVMDADGSNETTIAETSSHPAWRR